MAVTVSAQFSFALSGDGPAMCFAVTVRAQLVQAGFGTVGPGALLTVGLVAFALVGAFLYAVTRVAPLAVCFAATARAQSSFPLSYEPRATRLPTEAGLGHPPGPGSPGPVSGPIPRSRPNRGPRDPPALHFCDPRLAVPSGIGAAPHRVTPVLLLGTAVVRIVALRSGGRERNST